MLAGLLERAALRRPRAEAVIDGATRLTYAELDDQSAALGRGFSGLGVGRGDRVLIVLKNRVEHVLTYWALQRIAAVATPVNFRLAAGELAYLLRDSGARVVLFESATAPSVLEAARRHRDVTLVFVGDAEPAGTVRFDEIAAGGSAGGQGSIANAVLSRGPLPAAGPHENDLSLILYTSGTTGRPKGVPRTHENHVAGAVAHALQCGYTWEERTLGVMPLYHTMGIHALTSMVAVNGCFVCQPDWSPAAALRLIAAERLSALYLIPTLFYDLVHARERAGADVLVGPQARLRGRTHAGAADGGVCEGLRPRGVRQSLRLHRDLHVLGAAGRPPQAGLCRAPRHQFGAARRHAEHGASGRPGRSRAGR